MQQHVLRLKCVHISIYPIQKYSKKRKERKKTKIAGLLYPVSNFKCSPAVSAQVHVVISC